MCSSCISIVPGGPNRIIANVEINVSNGKMVNKYDWHARKVHVIDFCGDESEPLKDVIIGNFGYARHMSNVLLLILLGATTPRCR